MSCRWQEDLISHTLALSQIQGGEGTSLQKHSAVRSHRSRLGMGDLGSMSCRLFRAWLPTPNASRVSTNTCTQLSEEPGTAQEFTGGAGTHSQLRHQDLPSGHNLSLL